MLRLLLSCFLALGSSLACAQVQEVYNWPTINSSVSITTGSTFQTVLAAVPTGGVARRSLTIQNNNTSADSCWVFIGALASATKATSIILDSGHGSAYTRYYPFAPSDAIQATCATNGDTLYVDSQ